jgi:acetyl-CoA acetyltransferase
VSADVAIVGIGIHPFGRHDGVSGSAMGAFATRAALADAGVEWKDLQFAYGGSLGSSTNAGGASADTMVSQLGLTGLPFINVANGCATAGSALAMACSTIESGQYDLGLVVGFDKHPRGAFDPDPAILGIGKWYGDVGMMLTTQFFAMKINRYMHDFGITASTLAKVAAKNFRNGALNPNAFRRKPISEEDIMASPVLNYPLRQFMFCAPDEGAAAVIMCRGDIAHRFTDKPVFVRATEIRTRRFGAYEVHATSAPLDQDFSPTVYAARAAYEVAGIGPEDVDVAQLQDTDAGAEVIHMAETGLCADGEQEKLLADGATEINGSIPVNTDGGLIANGEPIGASGLRQMHELVRQLRGEAGERQVPGEPRVGLAQVYGAPGTASATIPSL